MRIIIHVDLDSFYASAEEARKPELKGRAVVICMFSGRTEDSGAVATANYPARVAGIHAGMAIINAKRMAEEKKIDAVFLPADMDYYRTLSSKIMDLMQIYSDKFEQRSIDEAYLDVSKGGYEKAEESANAIKGEIKNNFGITCSIGIGPNKLIAKMASRFKKPDGLTTVRPEDVKDFLFNLPAGKIFGIGIKTEEALNGMGIKTVEDLSIKGLAELQEAFGKKKGQFLYNAARGVDDSPVEAVERQQISCIGTLKENTRNPEIINEKLYELSQELHEKLLKEKKHFRSVSIIAITENLETHTKSMTLDAPTNDLAMIKEKSVSLMDEFLKENPAVLRRCGVRVSSLEEKKHFSLKEF